MTRYSTHVSDLATPQNRAARPEQVKNSAGGYVFTVDKWVRLDRFLILGSEGGTYYATEKKLTLENATCIRECLAEDGLRLVRRLVEISDAGRAPKNDPAIFALAMAAGAKDPVVRQAALGALPKICRIGTHLFHFAQDVEGFRRWGRSLRRAIAAWYTDKPVDKLAVQLVKYQQRDGWGHRDLLRLSHPTFSGLLEDSKARHAALRWATAGASGLGRPNAKRGGATAHAEALPGIIQAFEEIHSEGMSVKRAVELIRTHNLPHECVPNEMKGKPEIWEAMLESMGITAVIRNLGKMTAVGLLKPMSKATAKVVAMLTDVPTLFKGRVHPMSILLALKTYASGRGFKGSLTWLPVREIVDALDEGFYLSFQTIDPTGKSFLLALDVSGSMDEKIGGTNLSCREATAALAMVTARSEKRWHCVAFTAAGPGRQYGGKWGGGAPKLTPLDISPRQRMDDVIATIQKLPMGGTDCAQPMLYALKEKLEVDVFTVLTDNETWHGDIHPFQALAQYRRECNAPHAKLVVVGMTATNFTIADPSDAGMLDVVGFDAAAPGIIADFAATREIQS
jgi:60 kDa SS-A/Ro ribonucleoprotein